MSPPIYTPDGSEVSEIVLPDGSTASEVIDPDGNVVFEAGPDIPDTSMFQSPLYQWATPAIDADDGTSPVDWPESIAGLSDASAVGSPTKTTQSGLEVVGFDPNDGDNDGHNWSGDDSLPTGSDPFSLAMTIFVNTNSVKQIPFFYGNDSTNEAQKLQLNSDGTYQADFRGDFLIGNTNYPSGEFFTIGFAHNGDTARKVYFNGSPDGNDTPDSPNVQDANHSLGYRRASSDGFVDGFVHDVVTSDVMESDQAFADYHTSRLG